MTKPELLDKIREVLSKKRSLENASIQKKRRTERHSSQRIMSRSPIGGSESPSNFTKSSRVSISSVPLWASSFKNPGPEFEKFQKKVVPFEKTIQETIKSSDIFEGFDTLIRLAALKTSPSQYQDFVGTLQDWLSKRPGKVQDGNPNLSFLDFMHVASEWFIKNFEEKHWTEEVQSDSRDLLFEELKARVAPHEPFLMKYINEFHAFEALEKLIELTKLNPSQEQHQGFVKALENWMMKKSSFKINQVFPKLSFKEFMFITSKWFMAQRPELLRINPIHELNSNNALLLVFAIAKDYMMLSTLGKSNFNEKLEEFTGIISKLIQKESIDKIGIHKDMICAEIKKLCGHIKKLDKKNTSFIRETSEFYKKQLRFFQGKMPDESLASSNMSKNSSKRKLSESKREKTYIDRKNPEDSRRSNRKNSKADLDKIHKSSKDNDKKKETQQGKIKEKMSESLKKENNSERNRKNSITDSIKKENASERNRKNSVTDSIKKENTRDRNKRASVDESIKIDNLIERIENQRSKEAFGQHKSVRRIKSHTNELDLSLEGKLTPELKVNNKDKRKTNKNIIPPSAKKSKKLEESKSSDKKHKIPETNKAKNPDENEKNKNKYENIKEKLRNKMNRKNSATKIAKLPAIQNTQTQTDNENVEVSNHNNNVDDVLTDESKIEISSIKEEITSQISVTEHSKNEMSSVKEDITNQVATYEELSFSNNTFLRSKGENSIENNINPRITFTENLLHNPNPFIIAAPVTEVEIESPLKSTYPKFNDPFQKIDFVKDFQEPKQPHKEIETKDMKKSSQTVHVFTYQSLSPPEKPKKNLELCQESIAEIPATLEKPIKNFEIISSAMAEILPNPLSIEAPNSQITISPPKKPGPIDNFKSYPHSTKIQHIPTDLDSNSSPPVIMKDPLQSPYNTGNNTRFNSMPNIPLVGFGTLPVPYPRLPQIPKHIYYVGSPTRMFSPDYPQSSISNNSLKEFPNYLEHQKSSRVNYDREGFSTSKIDVLHLAETLNERGHIHPSPQPMNYAKQFNTKSEYMHPSFGNMLRPNFHEFPASSFPKRPKERSNKERNQVPTIYIESPREPYDVFTNEKSSEEIDANDSGVFYIQPNLVKEEYIRQCNKDFTQNKRFSSEETERKKHENEDLEQIDCSPTNEQEPNEPNSQDAVEVDQNENGLCFETEEILSVNTKIQKKAVKIQSLGISSSDILNVKSKIPLNKNSDGNLKGIYNAASTTNSRKIEEKSMNSEDAYFNYKPSFQIVTEEILNVKIGKIPKENSIAEDIFEEMKSQTGEWIKEDIPEEISANHSQDLNFSKEINEKRPKDHSHINDSYKDMSEIESVDISTIPISKPDLKESTPSMNFSEIKESFKLDQGVIYDEMPSGKDINLQIPSRASYDFSQLTGYFPNSSIEDKQTIKSSPESQKSQLEREMPGNIFQNTNKQNQFNLKFPKIPVSDKKKANGGSSAKQMMRKSSLPDFLDSLNTEKIQLPDPRPNIKLSTHQFETNIAGHNQFLRNSMQDSETERQKKLQQIIDTYKAMRDNHLKTKEEQEKVDNILDFYGKQLNKIKGNSTTNSNLDSFKALNRRVRSSSNADEVAIAMGQRNSKHFVDSIFDKYSGENASIDLRHFEQFCFEYKIASEILSKSLFGFVFDQYKDSSSLLKKEAFVKCLHKIAECYFSREYDILNLTNHSLLPISTKYSMFLTILKTTVTRKSSFS